METFTALKGLVDNPRFHKQRQESISRLNISTIDAPTRVLIRALADLPYCFSLQSCYGHFLHKDQKNPQNIEPLPISESIACIDYRIAYIALCLQDSDLGRMLFYDLRKIPAIDPECIQFGCAEWFWKKQVNSYVLQVEPKRYMTKDEISLGYQEALHIEKIRNEFFRRLEELIQERAK